MRVLFAGGGTAGHINPAIAISKRLCELDENTKTLFVGTKSGMEAKLVKKEGFDIEFIKISGIVGRKASNEIKSMLKVPFAVLKAMKIIKRFSPDIVIGTGGYVSGPVLFAAKLLNIKTLIHEQNVFAGTTTKILSSFVDKILISFNESQKHIKKPEKTALVGNPIRTDLFKYDKVSAKRKLNLDDKPLIFVFGGSLGAKKINSVFKEFIIKNKQNEGFNFVISTGELGYESFMSGMEKELSDRFKVYPYIYNMNEYMAAADVVVARAGAISVSEIAALGKASVLIPSPNVTHNHQEFNARALYENGAAEMILEKDFDLKSASDAVLSLVFDEEKRHEIEENAKKIGQKDSTDKICSIIFDMVKK